MKYGHLETVNMTLRTLSPVFIGSGQGYSKKEYILDTRKELIHFPDLSKMTGFLKQRGLLPAYEAFLLNPKKNDFQAFLQENGVAPADYASFIRYTIKAGEAVHNERFSKVLTFIKDSEGRPYIPGSSLKGAIRTALAAARIKGRDWSQEWSNIKRVDSSLSKNNYLRKLQQEGNDIENKIFSQLGHKDRNGIIIDNPINDFMRGLRISDSLPISFENLILVGKFDRKPDGSVNSLPIFRECLAPGTEIQMSMTLETPMLKIAGLDLQGIEDALNYFAEQHYEHFEQHFKELLQDADVTARQGVEVILGGGAGFVAKTMIYNLAGSRSQALPQVAEIMEKQFPQHYHDQDVAPYKVSPHTMKTTRYQGSYYPLGRCELIIQR